MSKATDYKEALIALNKEQAARQYNSTVLSAAQRMHYIEEEANERENLLKKFGGTVVIAEGYEEKSPLMQRRKYVFNDGSEWVIE